MAKHKGKSTGPSISRQQQKEAKKAKRAAERERRQALAEAQAVKPQETPKLPWPAPRQPTESRESYRFLNPYNFVRYLPEPVIPLDDPDAQLLSRCAPPPHDRYIGLTGRITCALEAVTPLFISDSHDIKVTKVRLSDSREVEHKSYRFFQYAGKDAIPATSLRGMIRSLFEAVTNSPFSVFNGDERLEYRIDPAEARRFRPGIVQSLPTGDQPGVIALCEEAKVAAYYDDPTANILDDSWRCGNETYAIVGKTKNNVPKVELISRNHQALASDGRPVRHGWVKVTGRTIDTKRNESFFYYKEDSAKAKKVYFDADREADFNAVLHAQLHDRKEDFHTQVQSERLAPGNLVYVELETDGKTVRNIALVKVARLRYRHAIGDLLPDHLKPSEQYEKLDIASRVFGWVKATPTEDRKARVAYAGRVRFSHAVLIEDKGIYADEMPLAILGAPKPTTTLFYLRKKEGEWSEEERKLPGAATTIGYDGPNLLRGRKFYRHHGEALNRLEYERAGPRRDHQNRSVRGVRAPGNVFEFTIDFHNLAPVELGSLLWTLNLSTDEGCFFRLGYAKPLGFGSVRLSVEQIELLNPGVRYSNLTANSWRSTTPAERGDWLARFEKAMQRCYGKPLRNLPNIADLITLLTEPKPHQPRHIHYPRTDLRPDPEGKNFEWFVANKAKSTNTEKAGPNLPLELPSMEQGLPLLQKVEKK
ncbi:TIGR03986 family type III CRISPR-associated RAMP protein [Caldilinea sp.]|jgi:CRISPR-associated protein (TIGR03986 family)|uniref:TIGR03986 family type III CRISPR-associated RAMP protein n=1 Tax=Caldilinea sp. TaxID=2293560 RepID=UPI002625AFC0|nr:TIGR03986 family CRISPR-associated RAMP protein [uncultured Caldilinea sp.]